MQALRTSEREDNAVTTAVRDSSQWPRKLRSPTLHRRLPTAGQLATIGSRVPCGSSVRSRWDRLTVPGPLNADSGFDDGEVVGEDDLTGEVGDGLFPPGVVLAWAERRNEMGGDEGSHVAAGGRFAGLGHR